MGKDPARAILEELQKQKEILEKIKTRLDIIERNQNIIRHQFLANGKAIGEIEEKCRERGELLAKLVEGIPVP